MRRLRCNVVVALAKVLLVFGVAVVALIDDDDDDGHHPASTSQVKWESHLRSADLPPHFIGVDENNIVPLTLRSERRKRCSCGCSGCDLFPGRSCCSSSCCASQKPLPLACCPPPPPPKPCCQPAYGPCCPATPTCCPKPCCRGKRPEYEEYEEEESTSPAAPVPPRTCCPAPVAPAPPPPPPPPPPAPEPPSQCCPSQPYSRPPCRTGCPNGDCGCARPCCYYRNPACCDQGEKPCCPPELPCCPDLQLNNCIAYVPPCLRACPSCPCRKRISLGKRVRRDARSHCQPQSFLPPVPLSAPKRISTKAAGTQTLAQRPPPSSSSSSSLSATRRLIELSEDHVEAPPTAGRLYEFRGIHARVKRNNWENGLCQACIGGQPLKKSRVKRTACTPCTYLQPMHSDNNPLLDPPPPQSPVGTPIRTKRAGCLPHPQCTLHQRRYKRNLAGSQYCEPCHGHYGRKKREAERDQCMRREKRYAADEQCDTDEFAARREKRQAYSPKGILDIVKVLSKATAAGDSPGGCLKFPACVLAQKKRRKRHADRVAKYHRAVADYKTAVAEHAELVDLHARVKRQFFAPDQGAACVPCPAWVTMALASRLKRSANESSEDDDTRRKSMTLSEAIADIRAKKGYKLGFDSDEDEEADENESEEASVRRRKQSCQQSDDCLNSVEYAIFQKVYQERRTKREAVFRRKKCSQCGNGFDGRRTKRNLGRPNINASEQDCTAFPQCRHRLKRSFFGDDCNICTPNADVRRRKKRNLGSAQCYPCPGSK